MDKAIEFLESQSIIDKVWTFERLRRSKSVRVQSPFIEPRAGAVGMMEVHGATSIDHGNACTDH
jgi:hypothetical protein